MMNNQSLHNLGIHQSFDNIYITICHINLHKKNILSFHIIGNLLLLESIYHFIKHNLLHIFHTFHHQLKDNQLVYYCSDYLLINISFHKQYIQHYYILYIQLILDNINNYTVQK